MKFHPIWIRIMKFYPIWIGSWNFTLFGSGSWNFTLFGSGSWNFTLFGSGFKRSFNINLENNIKHIFAKNLFLKTHPDFFLLIPVSYCSDLDAQSTGWIRIHNTACMSRRERGEQQCPNCPMVWFNRLCTELDGLSASKAQSGRPLHIRTYIVILTCLREGWLFVAQVEPLEERLFPRMCHVSYGLSPPIKSWTR